MAKNTKKLTTNHGKPITSFFARTPKAPSQDAPSSSSGTTSSSMSTSKQAKKGSTNSKTSLNSAEIVPKTATKSLPQESKTSDSSPRNAEAQSPSQVLPSPSTMSSSLKRPRVPELKPEIKLLTTRQRSESFKSDDHRKGKFDSDSDVEPSSATVFVTSTPNTQRRKKTRLSPPEDEAPLPVIPSSQSEEELVMNTPNLLTPKAMSYNSRKRASFVTPDRDEQTGMPMDIEDDSAKGTQTLADEGFSFGNPSPQRNPPSTDQMLTPPPSDLPSLPPTPEVLDPDTKTARIIAEIKAKAYAETASSPEAAPFEFKEELDSSSSDEEDLVSLFKPTKKKTLNPSPVSVQPTRRSTRYALRNKSPSSPSNGSLQKANAQEKASPYRPSNKRKLEVANPFKAMLKEKKAAEKRGGGSDVFRKAELIASNISKHSQGDDTDMDTDEDIIDWDAAAQTARKMSWIAENSSSPNHASPSSPQQIPEDDEQGTLFEKGKCKGQIIANILETDKVSQQERESSQVKAGIRIWESSNAAVDSDKNRMLVEEEIHCSQFLGDSAGVNLLNKCLRRHDTSQASMLLEMDILFSIPESERLQIATYLCGLALSLRSGALGEPAARALERFWSSTCQKSNNTIHFAQILENFNHLGIDPSLPMSQDWEVPVSQRSSSVDTKQRENIIRRLLLLVGACARSERLEIAEIPNLTVALLLLGMDSEVSPDLLEDVTRTVNLVCHCLRDADQEIEKDLCQKILRCVGSYTPINKARMISLLSAGSDVTHKIATVVSYNVITLNNDGAILSTRPPLSDIVDQLIAYSGKNGRPAGKFTICNETNYDDIGFYTSILGVAVSNIRGYVSDELVSKSKAVTLSRPESSTKFGEKQESNVQMLVDSLENLHNKISDTRAAHLERSQAKTNIKGLSMIIYYQHRFWQRNDAEGRKTLAQYFKTKDKP